ncbi:MAG: MBL fold metallo-hydrolase [Rhodothermales bacterium]
MIVTCWGVRGTIPTPGEHTVRYGGNTTCVSVEMNGSVLILDAGTGIRELGTTLLDRDQDIYLLLTHLHTDHILGFPYFMPLYDTSRCIHLLDYPKDGEGWSPLNMFDSVHFPLQPEHIPCTYHRVRGDGITYLRNQGFEISALLMNHPGGAFGYRLEQGEHSFVFIPDNELDAAEPTTTFEEFASFCRGADVLCHDAQYLDAELATRHGWGHSCVSRVCDLAVAAGVKHLVLFHHDPERTDDALDALQIDAARTLAPHGIACTVAYEGLALDLGGKE